MHAGGHCFTCVVLPTPVIRMGVQCMVNTIIYSSCSKQVVSRGAWEIPRGVCVFSALSTEEVINVH